MLQMVTAAAIFSRTVDNDEPPALAGGFFVALSQAEPYCLPQPTRTTKNHAFGPPSVKLNSLKSGRTSTVNGLDAPSLSEGIV
jgi:hypothetical protein